MVNKMQSVIVVHGLQRSGNHAIIQWLRAHKRFTFYNNVIPIAPILNGQRALPPVEDFVTWLRKNTRSRTRRFMPSFLLDLALRRRSIIASLEDHELDVRVFRNVPCAVINVLVLRDPYNMFASRIRKATLMEHPSFPRHAGPDMDRVINLWKSHAREFLGFTNVLDNCVKIYFNSWFSDQEYRRQISRDLGLEFTDSGFSHVSSMGGGSSFDQTRFNGNNRIMNVLDRKSNLTDLEKQLFEEVFVDEDLHELARQVEEVTSGRSG